MSRRGSLGGASLIVFVVTKIISSLPAPGAAQSTAPGGFVESTTSTASRPLLTPAQIQAMLPARGPFTFPAPYNTQGVRITNDGDCAGSDCVMPVGYSYWRNMNNHVGSNTMYLFATLERSNGGGGPTLFSYNKLTHAITKVGALFDSSSALSWASGEGWYFSATRPQALYLNDGSALKRYDVITRQLQTVFDVSAYPGVFGSNRIVWQLHSSNDDRVHSGTVKDGSSYAELGCFAYREDTSQVFYFPRIGAYDECQIDKSGRWLMIKENVDGSFGEDNRIIDLSTATERRLLDENGAAGHSDNGAGYSVAADNWDNQPNAIKLWKFGQTPLQGRLVYHNMDWNVGAPNHVSHANSTASVAPEQQYACGSGANRTNSSRANEIICFPLDGSMRVLVVAPVMTNLNAAGGGDDYSKLPKGNLDVTGQYFMWTSNLGGNRLDAFIVRVPAHLLTGPPSSDTEPPAVDITAPADGAVVAGSTSVSAAASDNVGVAGVQFKLDGSNLGAEVTTTPYGVSWNPTAGQNGTRTLTAVARDAAGNVTTSGAVSVRVDTIPPSITGVSASGMSSSGATIGWTTNEPSNSQVEYGPTTSYGSVTAVNGALVTSHSSTLSGLTANTLYHYRVKSRDSAGHLATSSDFTFTTTSGPPPPPPPPPPGTLVAHWAFDEGTGTAAADASGSGHTATLVNGPVWTAGRISQALAFDGVNDHVAGPHTTALNAFPLTVAAWIKTSSTTGVVGIVNKYVGGSYNGYNVFMNGGALCAWYIRSSSNYVYDGGGCTLRTTGYNDNQWHHVVYVVDAAGGRLYVDGTQRGSQGWTGPAGPVTTTQPVHIARYPGAFGGAEYFPGAVDDVRIYSRALSASEIAALAQPPAPPSGLAAYWPLNDGSGTTAADTSGNGQTGTLVNGPVWTAGRHGQALAFDGTNDHVTVAHAARQNAFPLTVATWIKTNNVAGIRGIVNKYVAGSYNGYNVFMNGGAVCAWFLRSSTNYVYDGGGCTLSATGYNDNQWHHVVYVVDTSGAKLYVDGVLKGSLGWTGPAGATTTTQPLMLGRYPGVFGGVEYFPGSIDDVRIYNRALTASEVSALFASTP